LISGFVGTFLTRALARATLLHVDEYDLEPPRRTSTMLFLVSVIAIAIALLIAVTIIYKHNQRGKPDSQATKNNTKSSVASGQPRNSAIDFAEVKEKVGFLVGLAADISGLIARLAMLIWLVRDCRSRGVDGAPVWVFLVLIFGPLAFLIYIASRPQGPLVICNHCFNRIPAYAKRCHHCAQELTGQLEFARSDPFMLLAAVTIPLSILLFLIWYFVFAPPFHWLIITVAVTVA
jgi:hypothetical protein